MKCATKKEARETIERYMDSTAYKSGEINMNNFYWTLRQSGFGMDEANVVLAALVLAVAKFQLNDGE